MVLFTDLASSARAQTYTYNTEHVHTRSEPQKGPLFLLPPASQKS